MTDITMDERLHEVFSLVSDQLDHWKDPFDVHVPKTAATDEEIRNAVIWHAGGSPDIYDEGDNWFVSGAGYYEWVGA